MKIPFKSAPIWQRLQRRRRLQRQMRQWRHRPLRSGGKWLSRSSGSAPSCRRLPTNVRRISGSDWTIVFCGCTAVGGTFKSTLATSSFTCRTSVEWAVTCTSCTPSRATSATLRAPIPAAGLIQLLLHASPMPKIMLTAKFAAIRTPDWPIFATISSHLPNVRFNLISVDWIKIRNSNLNRFIALKEF